MLYTDDDEKLACSAVATTINTITIIIIIITVMFIIIHGYIWMFDSRNAFFFLFKFCSISEACHFQWN